MLISSRSFKASICLIAAQAVLIASSASASAGCRVVGDSVGVGLGQALRSCATSARVGMSSRVVAGRAKSGGSWLIVSLGSNDFPRGISARQRAASEAHVRSALSSVARSAGSHLIVVIPANGAHGTVAAWVAEHGVRAVAFTAGRDGIHPTSYAALAARVRAVMGE